MKERVIKQPPTDDSWESESYYENSVVYTCDGSDIKGYDWSNFRIQRQSVMGDEPLYVTDEIVVALGREMSKPEAVAALRRIIEVIKR